MTWLILVIAFAPLAVGVVYVVIEGSEHLRGADRLVDDMRRGDNDG